MYTYATLAQAKAEFNATNSDNDTFTLNVLRQLTARFERESGRVFVPVIDTKCFDAIGDHHIYNGKKRLLLRDDLLEATTVTDGSGTVLVSGTDYRLHPRAEIPAWALQGLSSYAGWHQYTDDPYEAISVAGVWGYHETYSDAWRDSTQDAINIADATTTTVTVSDADATDAYTGMALFSPGQLIKVESEYMVVLAVNVSTNVLTVQRGANGSTAAAHSSNLDVYIWQVEPEVQRAVARAAAYLVKRRAIFEQAQFETGAGGSVTFQFPKDMEAEWGAAVSRFYKLTSLGI